MLSASRLYYSQESSFPRHSFASLPSSGKNPGSRHHSVSSAKEVNQQAGAPVRKSSHAGESHARSIALFCTMIN